MSILFMSIFFVFIVEEKTPLPMEVSETVTTPNTSNDDQMNISESVTDVTVDQEALDKLKTQQQKYKTAAIA